MQTSFDLKKLFVKIDQIFQCKFMYGVHPLYHVSISTYFFSPKTEAHKNKQ